MTTPLGNIDWDSVDKQIQDGLRLLFTKAFDEVAAAGPIIQERLREMDRQIAAMKLASRSGE